MTAKFLSRSNKVVKLPMELISSDHCGPFPVMYGGKRYYSLFIDHKTNFVFFFEQEDVQSQTLLHHLKTVKAVGEKHSGESWKVHRSDKGSDYTSRNVQEWMASCGILSEQAGVGLHQQNGKSERSFRTYNTRARVSMDRAGMPHKYFFFAVRLHVARDNRTESKDGVSPLKEASIC